MMIDSPLLLIAVLAPLIGAAADKLRPRAIFVSSPTAIAAAAWKLYVVTGEIWPHLRLSAFELFTGLGAAITPLK